MIDETIFSGMEERNEEENLVEKPLFGENFVRRGIERDYIIDLRTAAEKKADHEMPEFDDDELESVLAAAVAKTDLSAQDGDSVSAEVVDQAEAELALVKRSAMFGTPKSEPSSIPSPIPANLFERAVDSGDADVAETAPIVLSVGGRSLFDQSVSSGEDATPSQKDVQFLPAEEVRQIPWWIRPLALSLCALVIGFGAIQLVRSVGSDDGEIQTTDRPAVSTTIRTSTTVLEDEIVATTAPVVVTAAPTTAITLLVTTEAPVTTVAPAPAVVRTTRRQPATTAAPATAAPTTQEPSTTAAPVPAPPTTAPQITIVAPTTAVQTTSASTTATTAAQTSSPTPSETQPTTP